MIDPMEAARCHAIAEYPKESCGFISGGGYVACENKHSDPLHYFKIDDDRYTAALIAGSITSIVHSHPNGPDQLSEFDLAQAEATALPWIVIPLSRGQADA
jgi:proteasome lid subunit RPN8/RPN11